MRGGDRGAQIPQDNSSTRVLQGLHIREYICFISQTLNGGRCDMIVTFTITTLEDKIKFTFQHYRMGE